MEKRGLIIFSLFLISILFITGCKDTVGGNYRTDVTSQLSSCPEGPTRGEAVLLSESASLQINDNCYKVVSCLTTSIIQSDGITKTSTDSYKPVIKKADDQFCQGARNSYKESEVMITTGCQYDGSCRTGSTPVRGNE